MLRKKHNLLGIRFGNGIVIEELEIETTGKNTKYPRQYQTWILQCDCGNVYNSSSKYLLHGNSGLHCGCLLKKDLIGMRFGKGIVIKYVGSKVRGKTSPRNSNIWELKCDCGKTFQTHAEYLMSGSTVSCGCQRVNFHNTYHKKSISTYFNSLSKGAKKRNRNISITKEQIVSLLKVQRFKCNISGIDISIENGSASLDRIDNDKGYSIDNVQWVHRSINYMKNTLHQLDFISLCHIVSKFQVSLDKNSS